MPRLSSLAGSAAATRCFRSLARSLGGGIEFDKTFEPPLSVNTHRIHSAKMAPVKKSKSAKSSENINSRLQLVVKSGKVGFAIYNSEGTQRL